MQHLGTETRKDSMWLIISEKLTSMHHPENQNMERFYRAYYFREMDIDAASGKPKNGNLYVVYYFR